MERPSSRAGPHRLFDVEREATDAFRLPRFRRERALLARASHEARCFQPDERTCPNDAHLTPARPESSPLLGFASFPGLVTRPTDLELCSEPVRSVSC